MQKGDSENSRLDWFQAPIHQSRQTHSIQCDILNKYEFNIQRKNLKKKLFHPWILIGKDNHLLRVFFKNLDWKKMHYATIEKLVCFELKGKDL